MTDQVYANGKFTPPEQRNGQTVINTHKFQCSFGALPGRENGVGGSATVHARQALEFGDQNIMVAPTAAPEQKLQGLEVPAVAYTFRPNTDSQHDRWYEPANKTFLVEDVLGTITVPKRDIIYAHMPISGEVGLEYCRTNGNPLVYLGHAWEIISATFFPTRDLKPLRLVTEYSVIRHMIEKSGGIIVTNTNWEAQAIAEVYSKPPTVEHLTQFMQRYTGGELSDLQKRQIEIAAGSEAAVQALGPNLTPEQIRNVCVFNPIGVDLDQFNPRMRQQLRSKARADTLPKLGISPDAVVVGSVGRIHPQKDPIESIVVFAKALELLGEEGANVHLLLAGPGERLMGEAQGYFKSVLEFLTQQYPQVANRVHIPGETVCPMTINAVLDIRLDTAQFETWGLSLQEAMAMGVPSAIKGNPVYSELYSNTGVIVGKDANELAEPLAKLIRDEAHRRAYGAVCADVGGRYSWETSVRLLGENVLSRVGYEEPSSIRTSSFPSLEF